MDLQTAESSARESSHHDVYHALGFARVQLLDYGGDWCMDCLDLGTVSPAVRTHQSHDGDGGTVDSLETLERVGIDVDCVACSNRRTV